MRLNKIFLILIIILFTSFYLGHNPIKTYADELSDTVNDQLNNLDFSNIDGFLSEINSDFNFKDFVKQVVNGETVLDVNSFLNIITSSFLYNIKSFLPDLLSIIIISLIYKIISEFFSDLDNTKNVIYFITIASVLIITSKSILTAFSLTKKCIESVSKVINVASPIILTLMISSGSTASATVYQPTVVYLINFITSFILYAVLPLAKISFIFTLFNSLTDDIKFNSFINFFNGLIKTGLGILFAIFTLFITLQGITSASYDGIYLRATKYAISNSIPIIGSYLSGGFDLVVAGSVLIKNAVGVGTLIIIILSILKPITYLICLSIVLKLSASIVEIVSDDKISKSLLSVNNVTKTLNISIGSIGLMTFIFIILLLITAGAYI